VPKVTFRHPDGSSDIVDVPVDSSVMSAAINHHVEGIVAECGGNAMCATCHVYVDPRFTGELPPVGDEEDEMLEGTASPRTERSRLSCQLTMTEEMVGLTVDIPPSQV
jgi:ferredoxin, 2Fe-2S